MQRSVVHYVTYMEKSFDHSFRVINSLKRKQENCYVIKMHVFTLKNLSPYLPHKVPLGESSFRGIERVKNWTMLRNVPHLLRLKNDSTWSSIIYKNKDLSVFFLRNLYSRLNWNFRILSYTRHTILPQANTVQSTIARPSDLPTVGLRKVVSISFSV